MCIRKRRVVFPRYPLLTTHHALLTLLFDCSRVTGHESQVTPFHALAASLSLPKKSTPLQSSKSSLFFGNTRGGGAPLRSLYSDLSALCVALLPASHVFSAACRLLFSLASLFLTRDLCFQQLP